MERHGEHKKLLTMQDKRLCHADISASAARASHRSRKKAAPARYAAHQSPWFCACSNFAVLLTTFRIDRQQFCLLHFSIYCIYNAMIFLCNNIIMGVGLKDSYFWSLHFMILSGYIHCNVFTFVMPIDTDRIYHICINRAWLKNIKNYKKITFYVRAYEPNCKQV